MGVHGGGIELCCKAGSNKLIMVLVIKTMPEPMTAAARTQSPRSANEELYSGCRVDYRRLSLTVSSRVGSLPSFNLDAVGLNPSRAISNCFDVLLSTWKLMREPKRHGPLRAPGRAPPPPPASPFVPCPR